MLGKEKVIAFIGTAKPDAAKAFYGGVLGLPLIEDGPFALEYDAGGIMLRVQKVQRLVPHAHTSLGWAVRDIRATVRCLMGKGVSFERYQSMPQDDLGIWTSPSGAQVAWLKDPDGNTLSLTQFP
jgi:catechol 2,3-dioxygenase-like lactoylglutathione lyase family enzyme